MPQKKESIGRTDLIAQVQAAYPDMDPVVALQKLFEAHGEESDVGDLEAVFEDFLREETTLTPARRQLATRLAHRTYLDLPSYHRTAQRLRDIHHMLGYRNYSLLDESPALVNIYFRLQPLRVQREIVQGSAFRAAANEEEQQAVLIKELRARRTYWQQLSAYVVKRFGTDSPEAQGHTRELFEAFFGAKSAVDRASRLGAAVRAGAEKRLKSGSAFAIPKRPAYFERLASAPRILNGTPLPDTTRAWAKAAAEELNRPLSAQEIASLQALPPSSVKEALDLAVSLNHWLQHDRNQDLHITPAALFDVLHGPLHERGQDPLFLAWAHKLILIYRNGGHMVDATLEDLWRAYTPPSQRPTHDALLVNILRAAEAQFQENPDGPMHITLESLAKASGCPQLRNILFAEDAADQQRACWQWRKGHWHPKDILNGLARVFPTGDVGQAEYFFAKPAPLEVAAPSAAPTPHITRPLTAWERQGFIEAERLFTGFETPAALINATLARIGTPPSEQVGYRAQLEVALKSPKAVIDDKGMPSLPHLWLMWTARPETAALGRPDRTIAALNGFFGANAGTGNIEGGFKELLWTGVNAARDGVFKSLNYAAYLETLGIVEGHRPHVVKMAFAHLASGGALKEQDENIIKSVVAAAERLFGRNARGEVRLEMLFGPSRGTIAALRAGPQPEAAAS